MCGDPHRVLGEVLELTGEEAAAGVVGLRVLAPTSFGFHVAATVDNVVNWLPAVHELSTGVKPDPAELGDALRSALY
jgi:hypothetical protein